MSYQSYEHKQFPPISRLAARRVLQTGTSTAPLFTLPEWWQFPPVPLMGEWHNTRRIERLHQAAPDGYDATGRRWDIGVLYEAPDDPEYGYDALIGVVTRAGHVGCLMPGYFYIRPFVEALTKRGMHFVVPVVAVEDGIAVPFLRGRALRQALEQYRPPHVTWAWPPWRDEEEPITLIDGEDRPDRCTPKSPVPVFVAHCFAAVWAKFTGVDLDGNAVVVSGAIIGGPTEVTVDGRAMLAVEVRPYQNRPEQIVLCGLDAEAELVDDPADYPGRMEHAINAVFENRPVVLPARHNRPTNS